jgi:heavy metal translocating P-type ATPase
MTTAGTAFLDPSAAPAPVDGDRQGLTVRLGATVAGVALLAVATVMARLAPDQAQLCEVGKALAATVVAAPVLWRGGRALFAPRATSATDPIVAFAVLAAMASGAFGTAVLVPTVLEIGRLFEERSSIGVLAALEGIRRLRAVTARRENTSATEEQVHIDAIAVGDVLVVRPGELFPADGTVLTGASTVDGAAVTGESRLEDVHPGSTVFAGTRNVSGLVRLRVTASGTASLMGRVVQTLADVERAQVPVLRMLDAASRDYLPVVLTVAATVLFLTSDMGRAVAVLVVACPTALLLAGPAAMVAAMTAASRAGILLKSARFLERIGDVDTLVLDKTGTVTAGRQTVRRVVAAPGFDERVVLIAAAQCAHGSNHPASRAISAAAAERGLRIEPLGVIQEWPGNGVSAETPEGTLRLGRWEWLREVAGVPESLRGEPGTASWVARDARLLGRVDLHDPVRRDARAAIDAVRTLGITRVVMLTGDRASIAEDVANELALDAWHANVHPDHKLQKVQEEQVAGRVVMMVGDGVNDALALAAADVGVAMGTGGAAGVNEVALGGADIALLGADLSALPAIIRLADRVRGLMTLNAVVAIGVSAGSMILAAVGWLSPVGAAAAQSAAVVAVAVNSGRLLRALEVGAPPADEAPLEGTRGRSAKKDPPP